MADVQAAGDEPKDSAVALLRLRRLLRRAREQAGLTQRQAAAAVGCSLITVMRIEAGHTRPSVPDVRALLEVYGADGLRQEAEQLSRAARVPHWTGPFRDVLSPGELACWKLETAAAGVDILTLGLLPGLLQTEQYARAAAWSRPGSNPDRVHRRVAAVRRRQWLLDDPPPLRVWLDERCLRRAAAGKTGPGQMVHLLYLANHPRITIRVVPLEAGVYCLTSFTLLHLADPPETLLYVEDPAGGGLVRQEAAAEVAHRQHIIDWCHTAALPAGELAAVVHDAQHGVHRCRTKPTTTTTGGTGGVR